MTGPTDRSELPSLDWIGDPARLRAQALAELAAAGPTRPPDRLQGGDSSSSIFVEVDARRRVRSIDVSVGWRARLQPGRVGAAILEAYGRAVSAALESRVVRSILDGPKQPAPPPPAGPATTGPRGPDDEEWLRSVRESLVGLSAQRDAYRRMATEGVPPEPATEVRSPQRLFTMTRQGATILGIVGDTARIQEADTDQLRREAYDLFRAAELTSDG